MRTTAAFVLLGLAGCAQNAAAPTLAHSTPTPPSVQIENTKNTNPVVIPVDTFGLRGTLDPTADVTGSINANAPAPSAYTIAMFGPDERIATTSIAAIMATHPDFDIVMGFAPGDGATALKAAMKDALMKAVPPGTFGHYRLAGRVELSTLDTGDTGITIEWRLASAKGQWLGSVTQRGATLPSRIAAHWGDFAKSAAEPAAEGIRALIAPANLAKARHQGNAS